MRCMARALYLSGRLFPKQGTTRSIWPVLFRQPYALQDRTVARIGVEGIKFRSNLYVLQASRSLLYGFIEPAKRILPVPQERIVVSNVCRVYIQSILRVV